MMIQGNGLNRQIIAELRLPTSNYGNVTLNSEVRIGIDNYSEAEFGLLRGKITEMSEIPNNQGNYIAVASFENGLATTTNNFIPYSEGMVGYTEVITQDLNLFHQIFQHLTQFN